MVGNSYLSDRLAIDRLKNEYSEHKKLIIGFDFDNTVFDYHEVGLDLQPVIDLLKRCSKLGFVMCLFTVPDSTKSIDEKIRYCRSMGVAVDYVNSSPVMTNEIKPYFNILMDDRAGLGSAYNILKTALVELKLIAKPGKVEQIAKYVHEEMWVKWAQALLSSEAISDERRKRWEWLFVPYDQLSEEEKEKDRKFVREIFDLLEKEYESGCTRIRMLIPRD